MLFQYKLTQTNFSKMSRTEPNPNWFLKNGFEPELFFQKRIRTRSGKTRFDSVSDRHSKKYNRYPEFPDFGIFILTERKKRENSFRHKQVKLELSSSHFLSIEKKDIF